MHKPIDMKMKKSLFFIVISLILLIIISLILLLAPGTPYSFEKFRSVLEQSNLQAPTSKYNPHYGVKNGRFKDVSNEYFYSRDNRYMVFEMCGEKNRSELRSTREWKVDASKLHSIFAKVKLLPLNQEKEFTFLQIHANFNHASSDGKRINKPLLRVVWIDERKSLYDHLWAVVRLSGEISEKKYVKIDLGKRPDNFFTINVEIKESQMKIYINNIVKVNMYVDFWKGYWNYFKAGVYNQGPGCDKVLFDELKFD